jgi:hypothetical protein
MRSESASDGADINDVRSSSDLVMFIPSFVSARSFYCIRITLPTIAISHLRLSVDAD